MQPGRPQKFHLAAPVREGAWHEVLVLGSDDRLRISVDVARRRAWLGAGQEVLAVLEPGEVRLVPGANLQEVEEKVRALAQADEPEAASHEMAARTRYLRLRVNADGRLLVPKDVRMCLGLDPARPDYVVLRIWRTAVTLRRGDGSIYAESEDVLEDSELP